MSSSEVIIEAKDGKLSLKQKSIKWDETTPTLRELLAFTDVVKGVEPSSPLTELPNTHHPLIAKLVVESDKSLAILVKHIKKTILRKCGIQDDKKAVDDPRLPNTMLTRVVQSVATRVNYGPQDSPAAFTIWRWEVNEPEAMFPDVATDPICNVTNVSERRREREDARRVFKESFDALTEDQRKALLDKPKKNATTKAPSDNTPSGSPATKDKKPARKESPTKANPNEVEIIELQPVPKAPKARKEAQLMRNFFKGGTKEKGSEGREPPASPGDFTRVFKAFLPREDTLVAPANSFRQKGKGKERAEIIILEDDGDVEMVVQASENAGSGSSLGGTTQETNGPTKHNARELLHSFLASVPASRRRRKPRATNLSSPTKSTSSKVKTHSNVSVREIMTKLNEAELTGDVSRTRQLQQLLKNRRTVPLKFLQFCDNVRPGYYGTWTRSSPHVGPRTPFARDHVAFDYSYDSGEDWEEEPEDAEDVVSNGSDEEEETATLDGDDEFDDWLVGDDEVEFEGGIDPANPARSISPTLEPNRTGKRKHDVEKEKEKEAKKRRVFKPLVPYSCGPVWETRLGDCPDHLSGFRIQLLNDCPFPVDPFTYVAEDIPSSATEKQTTQPVAPTAIAGAQPPRTADGFAVPALPPHLHPSLQINLPQTRTDPSKPGTATAKPGATVKSKAKKPFPAEHLPKLMKLVEGSPLTKLHLIEELGQTFKPYKEVKKYAIEAALSEVASRTGGKWKVKEELWGLHGIPATTTTDTS